MTNITALLTFFFFSARLLACCLIAPHRGNNIRSALAAGGQCPRGTVARPTCVCCQCVSCSGSGLSQQAVMGSFSFRFHALAVVLTYPRPLGRSQRLKQRPTLLLFTTTPTLVHSHLPQTPFPAYSTCCQHLPLWHHPLAKNAAVLSSLMCYEGSEHLGKPCLLLR
jgi:hypothetical protein